MIVLSATDITKEYGTDIILKDISFHVNGGDRIGLIGANGAGKTTLMKIIAGELPYEKGNYFISQNLSIGYLKQNDDFKSERTVFEEAFDIFKPLQKLESDIHDLADEIAHKSEKGEDVTRLLERLDAMQVKFDHDGGYSYRSEINGVLSSMAFTEEFYTKKISMLSGGERTRLSLACLLLKKPDILMLDEPTNHLDIGTLKWLEQYLKGYKGTIIVISHDRYFLDQLVNRIFEVENHKLYTYNGNYSTFAEQKAARRESEMRAYEKQQTEIARQEEIIRRFKQHNTEHLTKRALSREKMLEHMELVERPEDLPDKIKISFKQNFKSGNDVLIGEGIAKGFGHGAERRELFKNINFDIKRGERIAIVGANGIGKTTLLKIMMEELEPDAGRLKIGHNVAFGYYDQGQRLLNNNNTVLEELKESYRLYTDTEMRSILGRFLFRGDDVFLDVGSLSGGEKARLSLLKMMLAGSNTLLLDEPTNHLDIDSKEIFEDSLMEFPGTIIVVSHDRYFLNKIPTRILEVTPNGIEEYLGTYDYYVEKKQAMIQSGKSYLADMRKGSGSEFSQLTNTAAVQQAAASSAQGANTAEAQAAPVDAAEERRLKKERERDERRLARAVERIEAEIAELEDSIAKIHEEMQKPEVMTDHQALSELNDRLEADNSRLAECYDEWEKLMS